VYIADGTVMSQFFEPSHSGRHWDHDDPKWERQVSL